MDEPTRHQPLAGPGSTTGNPDTDYVVVEPAQSQGPANATATPPSESVGDKLDQARRAGLHVVDTTRASVTQAPGFFQDLAGRAYTYLNRPVEPELTQPGCAPIASQGTWQQILALPDRARDLIESDPVLGVAVPTGVGFAVGLALRLTVLARRKEA